MTFFSWYCKRHSARRLNTYDAKWRRLRQLYYNEFREKVDEKVSTAVNNVRLVLSCLFPSSSPLFSLFPLPSIFLSSRVNADRSMALVYPW